MSLFARLFGTRPPQDIEARLLPILKMMTLDGRVDPREEVALMGHMQQMGITREQASSMLERVKSRGGEIPLPTEPRHRIEVMLGACAMMVIDGDIAVSELGYLHYLAGRMEIPPFMLKDMIERAIRLGQQVNPGVDLQSDFEAATVALAVALRSR